MNTIYKYEIPIQDEFELEMPEGAEVLHVAMQDRTPYMWVRVDTTNPRVTQKFVVCGTGNPLNPAHGKYCGTFLFASGALVFHVFHLD